MKLTSALFAALVGSALPCMEAASASFMHPPPFADGLATSQVVINRPAEPRPAPALSQAAPAADTTEAVEVDELALLAEPALLLHAMASAIRAGDISGMQVLLPVYEKLPRPDPLVLAYVRAVDARAREQLAKSARGRQYGSWSLEAGARLFYDANVNNAPSRRHVGNWIFETPKGDHGIAWRAGAARLWPLAGGRSLVFAAGLDGKHYLRLHNYRDMTFRLALGPGHTNLKRSLHLTPFVEYRLVGSHAYSHTAGLRAQWDRWWTPSLQSLVAIEAGRQKHNARAYLDNRSHLASLTLVYRPDAAQHALIGVDAYREWGTRHPSDSSHFYNVRAAWARLWPAGPGLSIQFNAGTRRYQGPTLLSGGDSRRDHMLSASASVWHRSISHAGFTPRLTLSLQRTRSNDPLHGWHKRQLQVEVSRIF